ncbi:hypothetical protein [Methylophilus sp. Q8]|uniref:hypothetical protein n=1 Tax=Methylophilus sp. Q8 TaxID=1506586 RepID=UPI000646CF00|nr:hypothetical protein [Methylophilus sp. Q8]
MKWFAGLLSCWMAANAYALDLSGVYACTGNDAHEGKYTGTVTMKLRPEHSKGADASYDFQLEVPDYGVYKGHAAAHGMHAAMHFALPTENGEYGGKTHDFGTGIAEFKKNAKGQLSFRKFYFEPGFKDGNTGVEECVRK